MLILNKIVLNQHLDGCRIKLHDLPLHLKVALRVTQEQRLCRTKRRYFATPLATMTQAEIQGGPSATFSVSISSV